MFSLSFLLDSVKILSTFITLLVLSIQDWRTRELDARIVYFYLILSILLFFASTIILDAPLYMRLFYAGISLFTTAGLFILLYKTGLIGDGDVYIATALGLMFPYSDTYKLTLQAYGLLPPSMVIIFYASVSALVIMLTNVLQVIMRYRGALERLPQGYRIIVPLLGRPVKIRDYLNGKFKHYYPLQSFELDGEKLTVKFRLVTGVDNAEINDLRNIVERGLLNPDDYIWITPGLPFILYLLIGFILVLLVGDKPLLTLISKVI